MTRFRKKLNEILPKDGRPFVCDGSPCDKKVFVVGHKPANEMENGFWPYWDDCKGFDKDRWFEDYKETCNKVSPTRHKLNKLTELAVPVKVLETNVYPKASEERDTRVLDFLVQEIEPELVITHGKHAFKHFKRKRGFDNLEIRKFDNFEIVTCYINGKPCKFVSVPHAQNRSGLSNDKWSDSNLEKLAKLVHQALNA